MEYEYSESKNRKPPRRKIRMVSFIKILGGILFLVIVFEAFEILIGNLSTRHVVAQYGTIEKGFWAEILFLRKETLLTAPCNGHLIRRYNDGTRVPSGEIVAIVNEMTSSNLKTPDVNLQARLNRLNNEIQELHTDLARIQSEITNKTEKLKKTRRHSPAADVLTEDLTILQQEKKRFLRNILSNQNLVRDLLKKDNDNKSSGLVTIENPGFLYFQYDGWEKEFVPERFLELSTIDFRRNYSLKSSSDQVQAGEIVGKLIDPFHQIAVIIIDTRQTGIPEPGDIWWFKIGDNTLHFTIRDLSLLTNGKTIVALDERAVPLEFLPHRKVKTFVIYHRQSGICVPQQALFKKGHDMIVKVVKGDRYREEKVTVLETDGMKAVIEGIDFGTTIISR